MSILLFQDRTTVGQCLLLARSGTSEWGPGSVPAEYMVPRRLHALSEFSLARMLVAPARVLAERREYGGRRDVCLGRNGTAANSKMRAFRLNPLTIMGGP